MRTLRASDLPRKEQQGALEVGRAYGPGPGFCGTCAVPTPLTGGETSFWVNIYSHSCARRGLMSIVSIGGMSSLPLGDCILPRRQGRLQLHCSGAVRCRVPESTEDQPPTVGLAGGRVGQRKQEVLPEARGMKNGAGCGKLHSLVWMEHHVWQGAEGYGPGLGQGVPVQLLRSLIELYSERNIEMLK